MSKKDLDEDYEFSRAQYYKLSEQSQEMIEIMFELFRGSEHPRAGEVLSNMIKTNAELADRLMELQKKRKDVAKSDEKEEQQKQLSGVTNNNLFVGSTKDLAKMLEEHHQEVKDITPDTGDNEHKS